MALVVFMRGVNVGGHKTFQPGALAKRLAAFDVVNVGAAGTFVVRKSIGQAALRAELLRRLPFKAKLMICKGSDVLDLASKDSFAGEPSDKDVTRFVSVMAKRPRTLPRLPLIQPAGADWQVRIVGISGVFALSFWRRRPERTLVYPNQVVEKQLGVAATTRNWNTISAICRILAGSK